MKTRKIYSLLIVLMLFAAGAFMYACTPDGYSEDIVPISKAGNIEVCGTCTDVDLEKIVGQSNINGVVHVCEDSDNLYITFNTTDISNNALIKTQVGIFQDIPSTLNPSPKYLAFKDFLSPPIETSSTTIISKEDLSGTIYIAALAILQTSGPNWGKGTDPGVPIFGNPNSRYFTYIMQENCVTPPPPTDACSFSLGFWFAKPNVNWPASTITSDPYCPDGSVIIGSYTYCKEEARKIFRSSNKGGMTDAKIAFLQASTIKLSLESGKNITDANVLTALAIIDSYFNTNNPTIPTRVTENNINRTNVFPKNTEIRNAANVIGNYISNNHCGGHLIIPNP
jgi:hypothetical protein